MNTLIVLLIAGACICCVTGSIITINVFNKNDADLLERNEIPHDKAVCESDKCDEKCLEQGYLSGDCTDSKCNCHGQLKFGYDEKTMNTDKQMIKNNFKSCSTSSCITFCQQNGSIGGFCIGDRCYCF